MGQSLLSGIEEDTTRQEKKKTRFITKGCCLGLASDNIRKFSMGKIKLFYNLQFDNIKLTWSICVVDKDVTSIYEEFHIKTYRIILTGE